MNLKYWHSSDFTQFLMSSVGQRDCKGTETGMPAADAALAHTLHPGCCMFQINFKIHSQNATQMQQVAADF
jgi:hypothetical protein